MFAIFGITLFVTVLCLGLQTFFVKNNLFGKTKWNLVLCSAIVWIPASWILLPDWNSAGCPGGADALSWLGEKMAKRHGFCFSMGHWTYLALMFAGFVAGEVVYSGTLFVVRSIKGRSQIYDRP
jgi:hypothetical protein